MLDPLDMVEDYGGLCLYGFYLFVCLIIPFPYAESYLLKAYHISKKKDDF